MRLLCSKTIWILLLALLLGRIVEFLRTEPTYQGYVVAIVMGIILYILTYLSCKAELESTPKNSKDK